jgi:hypothetical protein
LVQVESVIKKIAITDIRIGKRARKDLGDLSSLQQSINDLGLLHPIVVDSTYKLIVGRRRLAACKKLQWDTIHANVCKTLDEAAEALRAERDENTCRLPLAPTEAVAIGERLEKLERPKAKERQQAGVSPDGKAGGRGRKKRPGNFPEGNGEDRARDRVGESVGMSGKTYEKAKAVKEAAEADPDSYGDLVEQMDTTGKVDGAYKKLKERKHPKPKPSKTYPASDRFMECMKDMACMFESIRQDYGGIKPMLGSADWEKSKTSGAKQYIQSFAKTLADYSKEFS